MAFLTEEKAVYFAENIANNCGSNVNVYQQKLDSNGNWQNVDWWNAGRILPAFFYDSGLVSFDIACLVATTTCDQGFGDGNLLGIGPTEFK